ncbi:hypothetical protein Ga0100231_010030 [Opitutaceae bacterium TAV4]|nr:hypothetical protein Ga0100231_010030 [Opitutaceae bacterium TAV4]RRJ98698.1 hypothetical protein Ga0100230_010150 [Opitutaceae bacterium TAV3]
MNNRDYIPRKDEDFHAWQANFALKLGAMTTRLGIPEAKTNTLESLQGQWIDALQLASQPSTRTPLTIEQKTHARDTYESFLRLLVRQHIANNEQTTDDDRVTLGLPIPKTTRTPAPVPTSIPGVKLSLEAPGIVIVAFFDMGNIHRAKPDLVHGAEIASVIRETEPTTGDDFNRSSFDTRSPFTFTFDISERGKTLWLRLRWENTRGEKGPWSDIHKIIIP